MIRRRLLLAALAALAATLSGCGGGGVLGTTLRFETVVNCYDGATATSVVVEYTSPIGTTVTVSPSPTSSTLTVPGYSPGQVVALKVRGTTVGAGMMAVTCRIFARSAGGVWTQLNGSTTSSAAQATFSKDIAATVP